jgi:hypothetical protein
MCDNAPCLNTLGLTISNGRGFFTVSTAGCKSPPLPVTISSTGEISGEGDLACPFVIESQSRLRGTATITGKVAGDKASVALSSSSTRGTFTATLSRGLQAASSLSGATTPTPGGASTAPAVAPALPSPDGLWRGTFSCSAVSSNTSPARYTIDLDLRIENGAGRVWGLINSANDRTIGIRVIVEGNSVTVTRTGLGRDVQPTVVPNDNSINGRFDGTTIRASGRYTNAQNGTYDCSLTLNRGR